ncbi:MAG: PIG-L family deacetylase [Flavobacteriales bacterium]|nr:PIG-L family deacetylase [Flavobacteriales bacterium]
MKRFARIALWSLAVLALGLGCHLYYLSTLAAVETYPEDDHLLREPNRSALVIVAHDDDMVGSAGTMSMLCDNGWHVREMCFYQQGGLYFKKDSAKNPVRKLCLQHVADIQGFAGVDPVDLNYRKDMMLEEPYMPIPVASFADEFLVGPLEERIGRYIEEHRPSVIFTLDDSIGGYGNPEHVLVSKLVLAYCRSHKNDPDFPVKRIYQPVFPASLAGNIMGGLEVYQRAKEVYGCTGMPAPDVQVNIVPFASRKKAAMTAYTTEQNSLRKFWPYYHWYPAAIYFRIFDRDFFRVIDLESR